MKHLKRLAAILLAAAMLLSLAACAEKQPTPSGNASDPAGSTSAPSETSGNTLATAASQTEPAPEDLSARYGGHANLRSASRIQNLDPVKCTATWKYLYATCVFETFLTRDADNNIAPGICDYELSDDTLTLKLWVRDGFVFSNGDPVDIYDIEATIKRTCTMHTNTKNKVLPYIASMEVDAAGKVLTLVFSEYRESILYYLATWKCWCGVLPKEICEKYPDTEITELADLIGTGPYVYSDWEKDVSVTLTKRADYVPVESDRTGFAGTKYGFLDSMTFITNTNDGSAALAVLNGDYDAVECIPSEYYDLARSSGIKETILPSNIGFMLYFNVDNSVDENGNFINVTAKYPSLRKAIMAAIDYEEYAMIITDKQYVAEPSPWLSPLYQTDAWVKADYYGPTNLEAAAKYLEQAKAEGWDGVERVQVIFSVDRNDMATLIDNYLTKANIPHDVILMEGSARDAFIAAGSNNNYDMLYFWSAYSYTPTQQPQSFTSRWSKDKEKNALIAKMEVLPTDSEEYIRLAKEYDAFLVDRCGSAHLGRCNWYWYSPETLQFNDEGLDRYFFNTYWEDPENHPKK